VKHWVNCISICRYRIPPPN